MLSADRPSSVDVQLPITLKDLSPIVGIKQTSLQLPGFQGKLLIEPATAVVLGGALLGSGGYLGTDLLIPNLASLVGAQFYLQLHYRAGSFTGFGNLQAIKTR